MAHLRYSERELSYQPIPLYRDINQHPSVLVKLDLNYLCIKRPKETFIIQVKNPHLTSWGITLNDLVIVEHSADLRINDLIVIVKNNEYKFYQYFNDIDHEKILFSLDAKEPNLRIKDWQDIQIAGVITNVVHQVRSQTLEQQYAA